jgi:hypothetical protein
MNRIWHNTKSRSTRKPHQIRCHFYIIDKELTEPTNVDELQLEPPEE